MLGRTNTGGGGGGLNFKVVGGTVAPGNPKENTIWVNTDIAITSWVFRPDAPVPVDGMVWISTGTSSSVEFNALKKQGIYLRPVNAKQCVNGAFVYKEAKIYQKGEWLSWWDGWLYNAGNQYEDITGGWQKTTKGGTATIGTSSMSVSASESGKSAYIQTENIINLSQFDSLCVNVTSWSSGDNSQNRCQIRVIDANGTSVASQAVNAKKVYTIDVSSLTSGYIRLFVSSAESYTHKMTVDKIWLE